MPRGPDPLPPEQRRRRNEPARGEWVELPPLHKSILPNLPKRAKGAGKWSARSRQAWAAWRQDPVTTQYAVADVQGAIDLIYIYEDWVRGDANLAAEIRQRQDRLGLNAKGRRDLRWRAPQEQPGAEAKAKKTGSGKDRIAHLSVVK